MLQFQEENDTRKDILSANIFRLHQLSDEDERKSENFIMNHEQAKLKLPIYQQNSMEHQNINQIGKFFFPHFKRTFLFCNKPST